MEGIKELGRRMHSVMSSRKTSDGLWLLGVRKCCRRKYKTLTWFAKHRKQYH